MRNPASALAATRPLLRITSAPAPTELATASEPEPVPAPPKPALEPPVVTRVDLARTLTSPSFVMLSRPSPPAMPADRVVAVSEPLVPPVPPKLNDELERERL